MKTSAEAVSTADGGKFEFDMAIPESLEEAVEIYGSENAHWLLTSGLKVKLQNIARDHFRQGKDRQDAEAAIRNYRPGATNKKSKKAHAIQLVTDNGTTIQNDAELKDQVTEAFTSSDWDTVISLLEG